MKFTSKNTTSALAGLIPLRSRTVQLAALPLALGSALSLSAADVTWTGGTSQGAAPAYWQAGENWSAGVAPTSGDNTILGTGGSTNAYILFDTSDAEAGSITLSSDLTSHNQILKGSTTSGVLNIYGLNGVLVTNRSVRQLQFAQNGNTYPAVVLKGSGTIGGEVGTNLFYVPLGEAGGSYGFTKTGPNTMVLWTTKGCTYSGPTTVANGTIQLKLNTAALGTNTIYLAGGSILCSADRSGVAPTPSPIVVTGDSTLKADGTSTTAPRIFPFSGEFSGTSGTLTIDNKGVSGNTFIVRLLGGFNFSRPIVLNSMDSTYGSIAMLQSYNAATNGVQVFSGQISGEGVVQRSGVAGSPPGTTILTGDNTYSGGTVVNYGTLLANNTTGSALGSGAVAITNLGVLGGKGSVVATTTVSSGGTVSPGTNASNTSKLAISDLSLGAGGNYIWKIASATGAAGTAWDVLEVTSWTDSASSVNPFTIKVSSMGVSPAGWSASTARDWVIIQSASYPSFSINNFTIDTADFKGSVAGVFGLYVDGAGSLHMTYTPAPDTVINVASGTKTQTEAGYATLSGTGGVAKTGQGELILDNPFNTYAGSTKILAGKLSLSGDAANGSGTLGSSSTAVYVGDLTGTADAALNINVDGVTLGRSIVVQAGSSGVKTVGTSLSSGNVYFTGEIALQDSAILTNSGAQASFSGDIGGAGGLTIAGSGPMTFSGIGTYSGPTVLKVPALNLNGPALGTNTVEIGATTVLDNTSGSMVILNRAPQTWSADFSFTGTSDLNLGDGPVTLTSNRTVTVTGGTLTVGGTIAGNGGLTKLGAGTMVLNGATSSSYTGGTTNLAGVLVVNGTASFGNGTGTLLLGGGNLLCTESHVATPISNPVLMTTDTIIYGTNKTGPTYLGFSGPFTVTSGKLTIGNKGWVNTVFGVRLLSSSPINWPIAIGDVAFDRANTTNYLELYSDAGAGAQVISGLLSGPGYVRRGARSLNAGGTSIFTAQNTFAGGMHLTGGAVGFGASSTSSGGVISSGPIGTSLFTIGNQSTAETNLTVFAHGGARVIENPIFLNGAQNLVVSGTNDITFAGAISAGGIPKTWIIQNTGLTTLAGVITSTGEGAPLTKDGPGTLVLSAANLYTGATTVSEGTLLAGNTTGSATGSNRVNVHSAGTLGGSGTVAGQVVVTNGKIAPGKDVGTLTLGGGASLANGGTYVWDLAANTTNNPGVSFDQLTIAGGNLVLDGTSQLLINFTGTATVPTGADAFWQTAHSWKVISLTGTGANTGSTKFASIVNGVTAAGVFSSRVDATGNVMLDFTPGSTQEPVLSTTITGIASGNPTLSWTSATSGVTYQVQCKTNLAQPEWVVLGSVVADGATASFTHTNGTSKQCFYRVIVP